MAFQETIQPEPRTVYRIGVIGTARSIKRMAALLGDQDFTLAFPWIKLSAASPSDLPGDAPLSLDIPEHPGLPLYPDAAAMLKAQPGLNMLFDMRGDKEQFHALFETVPSNVILVSRSSGQFIGEILATEKRRLTCELDLSYTKSLFSTIFDEVEEDILLLDTRGRILDMNKNVHLRKKREKADLVGLHCWELEGRDFCCDASQGDCPLHKAIETHKKQENLHTFVDSDGRMRYFRVYTYPVLNAEGELASIMEIRRDITLRTNMELRLRQSERMAAIGELSTFIAHEIRNPLFAIGGFANSLLRSDSLSDSDKEKVEIIFQESKRLDAILKNTLNFARPTKAADKPIDLNSLAIQAMDLLSMGFDEKGIVVVIHPDPGIPKIHGDVDLLKQCLVNLVKNAQEAMSEGGALTISTGMSGDLAYLEIEDTGPGIPQDIRDKVFSPFFSTKNQGSGLGLAMTKKIIEDLGGRIDLTCPETGGTRITLYFNPVLAVDHGTTDTPPPSLAQ